MYKLLKHLDIQTLKHLGIYPPPFLDYTPLINKNPPFLPPPLREKERILLKYLSSNPSGLVF